MSFTFATSSSPPRFPGTSHPPQSSPFGPNFGSFSPIPKTPTRHRQYKNRDFSHPTPVQENPRKAFLREQLKKRCVERAQKARRDQIQNRRTSSSMLSSDGFDYDDDAEMEESENQDAEDDVLNDELFRRIMASARHKQQHNFRLSYQLEVGSSVDPDMEDIPRWEDELQGSPQRNATSLPQDIPEEFDDEELAQYAEDLTQGELEEAVDDYFDLSDWDGLDDAAFASLENQAMQT